MNNDFQRNNGYATREDLDVLRTLDVVDLSQAEFKDVIDARNGQLTLPALGRLRAAAQRQAEAKAKAEAEVTG
jgi:hypothetical protein